MPARVTWGEAGMIEVESERELREALGRLCELALTEGPFIAELRLQNGDMLGIGLGRPESVVAYLPGTGMPPYYHAESSGDHRLDQALTFDLAGETTEFPSSQAVPVERAKDALVHFFETGQLAPFLEWVED